MARWLPTVAVVLAIIALATAVFRQPEAPPIDATDLAAIQQDLDAASVVADGLSDRVEALERAAATAPDIDVATEIGTVKSDVDDLATGLANACMAIRELSKRISDVQDSIDGSSLPPPPSIGGRC